MFRDQLKRLVFPFAFSGFNFGSNFFRLLLIPYFFGAETLQHYAVMLPWIVGITSVMYIRYDSHQNDTRSEIGANFGWLVSATTLGLVAGAWWAFEDKLTLALLLSCVFVEGLTNVAVANRKRRDNIKIVVAKVANLLAIPITIALESTLPLFLSLVIYLVVLIVLARKYKAESKGLSHSVDFPSVALALLCVCRDFAVAVAIVNLTSEDNFAVSYIVYRLVISLALIIYQTLRFTNRQIILDLAAKLRRIPVVIILLSISAFALAVSVDNLQFICFAVIAMLESLLSQLVLFTSRQSTTILIKVNTVASIAFNLAVWAPYPRLSWLTLCTTSLMLTLLMAYWHKEAYK